MPWNHISPAPHARPCALQVSWVSSDNTQQQDAPASCPGSVGGSVTLGANQVVACLFTINYASIQSGSLWASVVTSTAQAAQATQVTVPPVDPSSSTAVGACGMASGGFETGGVGQLVPVSFTADSTVPPSSAAPVQLCDSASFTFTGVFGPFTTCGQQMVSMHRRSAFGMQALLASRHWLTLLVHALPPMFAGDSDRSAQPNRRATGHTDGRHYSGLYGALLMLRRAKGFRRQRVTLLAARASSLLQNKRGQISHLLCPRGCALACHQSLIYLATVPLPAL